MPSPLLTTAITTALVTITVRLTGYNEHFTGASGTGLSHMLNAAQLSMAQAGDPSTQVEAELKVRLSYSLWPTLATYDIV